MSERDGILSGTSRRRFLAASGAAVLAAGVPSGTLRAQSTPKYLRRNLSDPADAGAIQSYKNAITAMLKLPPTDGRNWYRNAFIHLLDCPHGNWWFLPWHRGYLGWFEQTCRELSDDPYFALPYWDWTVDPAIPASFADGSVLNPSNPAYIAGAEAFANALTSPTNDFYASLTPAQQAQLNARGLPTSTDFMSSASDQFFPLAQSRQPNFDATLLNAVSLGTIQAALMPTIFQDFGSGIVVGHSNHAVEGILESQPHDNIHGAVGGFMSEFLSPVDPIFFMHHSNIDRLWDVWTRKQQQLGLPTLPTGAGLTTWSDEPFLFYVDAAGKTVTANKAGDYATIGNFNYAYQPGTGEQFVPPKARSAEFAGKEFALSLSKNVADFREPAAGTADVPAVLKNAVIAGGGPELVARVTLMLPANRRGLRFHVLVNPPKGVRNVRFNDPSFAGTITPFGSHGHGHMNAPVSFDVPLSGAVRKLRAAGLLKADEPLSVQVVPDTVGVTLSTFEVPVNSISIRTL